MKPVLACSLALAALLSPYVAAAESRPVSSPVSVVKGYFAALACKNFGRALELTTGSAQRRTRTMVGTLEQQAADHHANVELKLKRLDVAPRADIVEVTFAIDVIGKKWMFSKVARTLQGTARFSVDDDRIVAIEGQLD